MEQSTTTPISLALCAQLITPTIGSSSYMMMRLYFIKFVSLKKSFSGYSSNGRFSMDAVRITGTQKIRRDIV